MELSERTILLNDDSTRFKSGLSIFFAMVCIIDIFGVFPIITLPNTIMKCGMYGLLLVMFVCSVQIYTSIMLGNCWLAAEKIQPSIATKSRYPYSALADLTYGKKFSKFVTILLNVTVFGGGIPNIIVAAQNLELFGLVSTAFDVSYCSWMVIIGVAICPILWLGSPKDMKCLCTISVLTVLTVFFLIIWCIYTDQKYPSAKNIPVAKDVTENIIIAYGVLTFQFDIHPTVLTIQVDMKKKVKLSCAILCGFGVTLSMFLVVFLMAFFKYGSNLNYSLLETLPTTVMLYLSSLLVAFQLGLSSAIGNSALYHYLEDLMNIPREFSFKRCFLRSSLIFMAILLGESVPKFEMVMSLIGGCLTGPLVYVIPPLMYLRMVLYDGALEGKFAVDNITCNRTNVSENENCYSVRYRTLSRNRTKFYQRFEIFTCISIILLGAVGTVATTYINIRNTINNSKFSDPCIHNFTNLF